MSNDPYGKNFPTVSYNNVTPTPTYIYEAPPTKTIPKYIPTKTQNMNEMHPKTLSQFQISKSYNTIPIQPKIINQPQYKSIPNHTFHSINSTKYHPKLPKFSNNISKNIPPPPPPTIKNKYYNLKNQKNISILKPKIPPPPPLKLENTKINDIRLQNEGQEEKHDHKTQNNHNIQSFDTLIENIYFHIKEDNISNNILLQEDSPLPDYIESDNENFNSVIDSELEENQDVDMCVEKNYKRVNENVIEDDLALKKSKFE